MGTTRYKFIPGIELAPSPTGCMRANHTGGKAHWGRHVTMSVLVCGSYCTYLLQYGYISLWDLLYLLRSLCFTFCPQLDERWKMGGFTLNGLLDKPPWWSRGGCIFPSPSLPVLVPLFLSRIHSFISLSIQRSHYCCCARRLSLHIESLHMKHSTTRASRVFRGIRM